MEKFFEVGGMMLQNWCLRYIKLEKCYQKLVGTEGNSPSKKNGLKSLVLEKIFSVGKVEEQLVSEKKLWSWKNDTRN